MKDYDRNFPHRLKEVRLLVVPASLLLGHDYGVWGFSGFSFLIDFGFRFLCRYNATRMDEGKVIILETSSRARMFISVQI